MAVASVNMKQGLMTDWFDQETDNWHLTNDRNFYKVGKWTKRGTCVDQMLDAGNNLEKARELVAAAIKHRPRTRRTIGQRMRVLERWPKA